MKRKITVSAAAAVMAAVIALTAVPIGAYAETDPLAGFSFEQCTAESDCIVLAKYKGKVGSEYKFSVVRMIKGSITGSFFYVTASEDFGAELVSGTKYVLYLDRDISVYYAHDKYTPNYDIIITADKRNNITGMTVMGEEMGGLPETVTVLTQYTDTVPSTAVLDEDYIRSGTVYDLMDDAKIIVKVKVGERTGDYMSGSGIYECTLLETKKGKAPATFSAALFDSTIFEGEEYYLMLSGKNSDGVYELNSKKSAVRAQSTAAYAAEIESYGE
ncbi:MAG: hypothetical protein MR038_04630 [Oscillospiraceae bacterium]|nr:hypothetical protein [Oscillospiraceae bacterium]